MTTYFVTRHPGAADWARYSGFAEVALLAHLDVTTIAAGDVVLGTLPVNLAAEVCRRGGRYVHLTLDLPTEMRGRQLTTEEMEALGARLEEYRVCRVAEG